MHNFGKHLHRRFVFFALFILAAMASAQFPIKIPSISTGNLFQKESPLTTSLLDAVTEIPFLDNFDPQEIKPLSQFRRGPNNGFMIDEPGAYWFVARSYCFHAGTHSPGSGKGYLYAPLKGRDADIIRNVMLRSASYSNISQPDVQSLIWAILAQTKPSTMNSHLRSTADRLLTKEEISRLEGSAFDEVSQSVFSKALGKLPPQTQRIFEAERRLRSAMSGGAPYSELERIAVLTGEPLPLKDDRSVPSGRWSYQPDGYFIRYFPEGYQTTQMDVYFPEEIAVGRDLNGRITSITGTRGRRLIVEYDDAAAPLTVGRENAFKGYAFRSVRLESKFPQLPKMRSMDDLGPATFAEWTNAGWTFAGPFQGSGSAANSDNRYERSGARYDAAKRQNDELKKLLNNLQKFDKKKKLRPFEAGETEKLLNLMQLTTALNDLLAERGLVAADQFFDPVELAQRAWAVELDQMFRDHQALSMLPPGPVFGEKALFPYVAMLSGGNPSLFAAAPSEFNSDNGAASPGDTGRQRLGVSSTPTDRDQKCKQDFKDCQTEAGNDYLQCFSSCGASMPPKPTLGQLNDARKCFSACETNYSQQNRECSRAAKKCAGNR